MTAAWKKLHQECAAFFKQIYVGEDRVLVLGEGNEKARLMLIGEAPGEQEALQKRPFVGKAGKQLDDFLQAVGMARSDLYITNAVKFRPTRVSAAGRVVNRPPTREEIALWRPWLLREIGLIKPAVIATLGNVSLRAVTGKTLAIGETHGAFLPETLLGARIFPLYHPASVIYRRSLAETYAADLQTLRQRMDDI